MAKFARAACYALFTLVLLTLKVTGRFLRSELISDGTDDTSQEKNPSFLHLKGIDVTEEHCEQMYGFLPCSENIYGHFFLIVVYQYLLYKGESYVSSGGHRIFQILGPGIFGASAFQVLGFLPESLILLVSGLSNTKDVAQEYVLTGVGLLAGSAILLLTLVWGTCVIVGSRNFSSESESSPSLSSTQSQYDKLLSYFTGCGVTTDHETSFAAKIMVLSVIPFAFFLILETVFGVSNGYIFMIPLSVSFMFLIVYFTYQVFEPSIQKRRLSYVKHEHLVVDIIKHLQEHMAEQVLNEDGSANLPAIRRLFTKIDQDGDSYISFPELKELLQDIKFRQLTWSKEKTIEEIMKEFDKDSDSKVTMDEFVEGFKKWLDETKNAANKRQYRSISSWKDLEKILQPWYQTKKKEEEMMKILISEIIRHVDSFPLGGFYNDDGTTNISAIKRLFERIDLDKDNFVSQSELKKLILEINSEKILEDVDAATAKLMHDLDISGDQQIDEVEFINGFKNWLNTSNYKMAPVSPGTPTDKPWERWMDDGVDRSGWAWTKAIMSLVLGITMLGLLAEPLIHSVQNVSSAANISSFFIAFIVVPLATNARAAISAIKTASHRNERTTSLTFSELYDGVYMNNVLGFFVLLAVIYIRGLTWEFSAEVLVVLIVCSIMGAAASLRSKFPIWTSFIAYLLYPLSLLFVFLLYRL
ncbi:sodium/calcium exchanger membrane region, EF-hand domain pair [Artemisia annua]|uniref:Sodium/calcium exchanger membrane region, EF-hand domain pair n=1 Tax=Artemisia annua TaxID=35608 RepID=A0A2U1PTV5_ARTAN|nr:sodium/calcium exchanger membrane region, EF-hand domain pair [Artemisia annua]